MKLRDHRRLAEAHRWDRGQLLAHDKPQDTHGAGDRRAADWRARQAARRARRAARQGSKTTR